MDLFFIPKSMTVLNEYFFTLVVPPITQLEMTARLF